MYIYIYKYDHILFHIHIFFHWIAFLQQILRPVIWIQILVENSQLLLSYELCIEFWILPDPSSYPQKTL